MPTRKESLADEVPEPRRADDPRPHVIVIVGPTASGKSTLAIQLSQKLGAPILSADSRQVYRELDIGVARPTPLELAAAPHHLIAYVSIHEPYSAGQWARDARACLVECFGESRQNNPTATPTAIIAGGSGLHVKALLDGLPEMPAVAPEIRDRYDRRLETDGLDSLLDDLDHRDPAYGRIVDRANPARVTRALAAMDASGTTFTELRARPTSPLPYRTSWIVLEPPRSELFPRIDARVDDMLAQGLEAEALSLAGFRDLPALQTIGYREWWPFFDGATDKAAVIAAIKSASRGYARRQSTWNRRLPGLRLEVPSADRILKWLE